MDILRSIFVWLTGILFLLIFFPVTFIIWLLALPFDRNRSVIHQFLVWQSKLLTKLIPIWEISITGRENAIKGSTYVIISNHQSIIDILMINSLGYRFKWISKIENMKIPILGWYLRMADYITVDRGDDESKAEMLDRSLKCLKSGISIMIFPEGTRSLNKNMGFFKRGAFQLAIESGLPLLPVIIDGTGDILPKHGLIFRGNHKIKLKVFEPILPTSFGTTVAEELALKVSSLMNNWLKDLRT